MFYKTGGQKPFEKRSIITQQRVDEILDKINQKVFFIIGRGKEYFEKGLLKMSFDKLYYFSQPSLNRFAINGEAIPAKVRQKYFYCFKLRYCYIFFPGGRLCKIFQSGSLVVPWFIYIYPCLPAFGTHTIFFILVI